MFRALLERTSRRVTLTPAGAVLLEQGRIAVEAASAAVERARRKGTQACRLTVAVKPGTATELLTTIMQRCAQNPAVPEVHILFGTPADPWPRSAAAPPTSRPCSAAGAAWTELRAILPAAAAFRPGNCAAPTWPAWMPRWAGSRPGRRADWAGPTPRPGPDQLAGTPGSEINDISQLRTPQRRAYVPISVATSTAPRTWSSCRSAT